MSNRAAIIPSAKAPLEVQEVEKYKPGSGELLIKNTSIAFNPIEWKVARRALVPVDYPEILGNSFAGTVEAVGSGVTDFQVGVKVAVSRSRTPAGAKYGAFQLYVLGQATNAVKLPEGVSVDTGSSIILNFRAVAGVLTATAGLDMPSIDEVPRKGSKILIYGGTSSMGSLAIQYATQAGYTVISTTSPKHKQFVSTLGAAVLVDHTQPPNAIKAALIDEGPYEVVFDTISLPQTIGITADILKAQGGGVLYTIQPPFGPETLPEGVSRHFDAYSQLLEHPEHTATVEYLATKYLPQALANGKLKPIPIEKLSGGLAAVDATLTKGTGGVSGVKMVLNPWEA